MRWLAPLALLIALGASSGCGMTEPSQAATPLTIATGGVTGVYYPLGRALAAAYSAGIPGIAARAEATGASGANVEAIQQGTMDVAFSTSDIAYLAYTEGTSIDPTPHARLRGIAVLYPNVFHIVVRADSNLRSVRDLAGRQVGFGFTRATAGGARADTVDMIAAAHGLARDAIRSELLPYADVVARLGRRELDAGVLYAGYPLDLLSRSAAGFDIRLLDIDHGALAQIREENPFLKRVVIPSGTYQDHDHDIEALGGDNLLVCREDLPEELVYQLTREFYEALPELASAHPAARLVNPEQGPSTPIPLHPGAMRYYRERELFR
jgi:TRAP transporter TAXI family solute receptor